MVLLIAGTDRSPPARSLLPAEVPRIASKQTYLAKATESCRSATSREAIPGELAATVLRAHTWDTAAGERIGDVGQGGSTLGLALNSTRLRIEALITRYGLGSCSPR